MWFRKLPLHPTECLRNLKSTCIFSVKCELCWRDDANKTNLLKQTPTRQIKLLTPPPPFSYRHGESHYYCAVIIIIEHKCGGNLKWEKTVEFWEKETCCFSSFIIRSRRFFQNLLTAHQRQSVALNYSLVSYLFLRHTHTCMHRHRFSLSLFACLSPTCSGVIFRKWIIISFRWEQVS